MSEAGPGRSAVGALENGEAGSRAAHSSVNIGWDHGIDGHRAHIGVRKAGIGCIPGGPSIGAFRQTSARVAEIRRNSRCRQSPAWSGLTATRGAKLHARGSEKGGGPVSNPLQCSPESMLFRSAPATGERRSPIARIKSRWIDRVNRQRQHGRAGGERAG